MPPYALFTRALFSGRDFMELEEAAERFCLGARAAMAEAIEAAGGDVRELLQAAWGSSPIQRKQGLYRYQALFKLLRTKHTGAAIQALYAYTNAHRGEQFTTLEVNPQDLF
jgi:primosomal protein N'